jgi:OOP family OmpA-OmpF porin
MNDETKGSRQGLLRTMTAGALLALAVTAAGAADNSSGFYIGAGVGNSRAQDWCGPYIDTIVVSCDNNRIGYKLFGGYQLNDFLGLEAAYVDFGKFSSQLVISGIPVSDAIRVRGGTLQAVLSLPIVQGFTLFAKGGGIYWDVKSDTTIGGVPANRSGTGFDAALGAGAQYFLTRDFAVRAEWEYYPNLGNQDIGDNDYNLLSIAALWKF